MQRYFFHSFPRRRANESEEVQRAKGIKIAESLLKNGLLLTPENHEIPVFGLSGAIVDRLQFVQRRACFTELEPTGLPEHAKTFGPFSLTYEIPKLRQLGALPVFYIPLQNSDDYLSGLATELIGGFADSMRLVGQINATQKHLTSSKELNISYGGKSIAFSSEEADAVRRFISVLADAAACDLDETQGKLGTVASCFYPTENPVYTEPLHYYRQREWRIIGGCFAFQGQPWGTPATKEQIEELLRIDSDFFGKQLTFFEPKRGVGAKSVDAMANRSYFLKEIAELDIISAASFLVIPDEIVIDNAIQDAFMAREVRVVRQSEFCGRRA